MLATAAIIETVADRLAHHRPPILVLDPVLVATSGRHLLPPAARETLLRRLLPLATLVTPNLPEAAALTGRNVTTRAEMIQAAACLAGRGARAVLVKGGHLAGAADDLLYANGHCQWFPGQRLESRNTHGTGCTLAAAIAANLARGLELAPAIRAAKEYVARALCPGLEIGHGPGPLDHFGNGIRPPVAPPPPPAAPAANSGAAESAPRPRLDPRLYLVTDRSCVGDRDFDAVVEAALRGGVTLLQLREKELAAAEFLTVARRLRELADRHGVPLIVNDRLDLALAADAAGLHLGQGDLPAAAARRLLRPGMILGVSCKTVEQARQAERDGADYIGSGAVYPTTTKVITRHLELAELRRIQAAVRIPVVAIGGITPDNAAPVLATGVAGLAVVSAIMKAADPEAAARRFRALLPPAPPA
jgi:hydroxymethylpyrimidine kinase/phosphomethylpyrimidine kinase/thiamine-phosphate diphosphorylase